MSKADGFLNLTTGEIKMNATPNTDTHPLDCPCLVCDPDGFDTDSYDRHYTNKETEMTKELHNIEVMASGFRTPYPDEGYHYTRCACGWWSPLCMNVAGAVTAGVNHVAEKVTAWHEEEAARMRDTHVADMEQLRQERDDYERTATEMEQWQEDRENIKRQAQEWAVACTEARAEVVILGAQVEGYKVLLHIADAALRAQKDTLTNVTAQHHALHEHAMRLQNEADAADSAYQDVWQRMSIAEDKVREQADGLAAADRMVKSLTQRCREHRAARTRGLQLRMKMRSDLYAEREQRRGAEDYAEMMRIQMEDAKHLWHQDRQRSVAVLKRVLPYLNTMARPEPVPVGRKLLVPLVVAHVNTRIRHLQEGLPM